MEGLRGDDAARRKAIDTLYRQMSGRLVHFMRRADSAQAEDLMHQTFINILRNLESFRGEGKQLQKWVWTIARNARIDWLKKHKPEALRRMYIDDNIEAQIPDENPDANPAQQMTGSEFKDCVQRGTAKFKQAYADRWQCLSWHIVDEFSIRDIAELIDRTENATKVYLGECRKKLRPYLAPCQELIADGEAFADVLTSSSTEN